MLIVRSGLPGNPLRPIRMKPRHARLIATELIESSRSFYFEPLPDDWAKIEVDPEHAEFVEHRLRVLKGAGYKTDAEWSQECEYIERTALKPPGWFHNYCRMQHGAAVRDARDRVA